MASCEVRMSPGDAGDRVGVDVESELLGCVSNCVVQYG
jgi:hypothetical protein